MKHMISTITVDRTNEEHAAAVAMQVLTIFAAWMAIVTTVVVIARQSMSML